MPCEYLTVFFVCCCSLHISGVSAISLRSLLVSITPHCLIWKKEKQIWSISSSVLFWTRQQRLAVDTKIKMPCSQDFFCFLDSLTEFVFLLYHYFKWIKNMNYDHANKFINSKKNTNEFPTTFPSE